MMTLEGQAAQAADLSKEQARVANNLFRILNRRIVAGDEYAAKLLAIAISGE